MSNVQPRNSEPAAATQFLENTDLIQMLVSSSPAACMSLLCTTKFTRAAALSELRRRLSSGADEEQVAWLLGEMRGIPTIFRTCNPFLKSHLAYAAARLPVYGLLETGKKTYTSHTEWSTLKPRLLQAVERLVQLPSHVFHSAVFATAAPPSEMSDMPIALRPAAILQAVDSINAIKSCMAKTLATKIEVAPSLNATTVSRSFDERILKIARSSIQRDYSDAKTRLGSNASPFFSRLAAAMQEAFRQHHRLSQEAPFQIMQQLLEEALASNSSSSASTRVLVLEAALAALQEIGRKCTRRREPSSIFYISRDIMI